MSKHTHKIILFIIFFNLVLSSWLRAEIIDKINITGNERISKETIKMFSGVSIQDDLSESDLNGILKKLYNTNFFDLVSVKIKNKVLRISSMIIVERDSQKGIIIGNNGESIKKLGSESRKDLEVFFKRKVFLELNVKVYKDWRKNSNQLKKLGYN